jgi:hypothetical protein
MHRSVFHEVFFNVVGRRRATDMTLVKPQHAENLESTGSVLGKARGRFSQSAISELFYTAAVCANPNSAVPAIRNFDVISRRGCPPMAMRAVP